MFQGPCHPIPTIRPVESDAFEYWPWGIFPDKDISLDEPVFILKEKVLMPCKSKKSKKRRKGGKKAR